MLTLQHSSKKFWDHKVEGYVFFLNEKLESLCASAPLDIIEKDYYHNLKTVLKKHQFEGKRGQSFVLSATMNDRLIQFIFIGVGAQDQNADREREYLRRATGCAVKLLKQLCVPSAILALPTCVTFQLTGPELCEQITIAALMADYEFIQFKSVKPAEHKGTLTIVTPDEEAYKQALDRGVIIGTAINDARHLADLPGNIVTPTKLSEVAQGLAKKHNLQCTVFGHERARELGMGAFLAVDVGSDQDGKMVILEYKTDKKDAKTIALCGKGVTFDTGGISLKPANSMDGMKFDMSGAAAVMAVMDIIARLKPDVNVIGITPLVENMPSGKASHQDDVVIAMNGTSIEIKNTDAEGRLILSDALCYAEKFYQPDVIIDIATLTGACLYALGHFYSAVISPDQELSDTLFKIGAKTGDKVWPLPIDDDFKKGNESDVADLNNSGSSAYLAGTIIGACFLSSFVKKARWAHLDIAGTAHHVPGINYLGKGATGVSIRLLTEFIMTFEK